MKELITFLLLVASIMGLFYERKQFFERSSIVVKATIVTHIIIPGSRKTSGQLNLVFVTEDGKRFSRTVDPVMYSYPDGHTTYVNASVYDFGQTIPRPLFWITFVLTFASAITLMTMFITNLKLD